MNVKKLDDKCSFSFGNLMVALTPLICGILLAMGTMQLFFTGQKTDFADLALGEESTTYFAHFDGHPVHCTKVKTLQDCLAGWKSRGEQPTGLILGNSQLHAVNQLQKGETTLTEKIFSHLHRERKAFLAVSLPNVSLQEHLVLFEYMQANVTLEYLVLALVFDDLREDGLREEFKMLFSETPLRASLEKSATGRRFLTTFQDEAKSNSAQGKVESPQEIVEATINRWLEENSPLWAARPEARGSLFVGLYRLRNYIFGINPQSKRKMIASRYQRNIQAYKDLLSRAKVLGIKVITYIAPIRNDIELPYVDQEYRVFKETAETLAKSEGGTFTNLESLVPAQYWGEKDSTGLDDNKELDFMHFKAAGHTLLANRILSLISTTRGDE